MRDSKFWFATKFLTFFIHTIEYYAFNTAIRFLNYCDIKIMKNKFENLI